MTEPLTIEPTLRAVGVEGAYRAPASQEQARLWLLASQFPTDRSYHMAYSISLRGLVDPDRVALAIAGCVARHDAFRTIFFAESGTVWQIVEPIGRVACDVLDLPTPHVEMRATIAEKEEQRFAELPFSLTTGPLARFRLLHLGERDYRLVVAIHHIIGDGWSHAVLVRDFSALYGGPSESLEAAPLQYVDYALWQQRMRDAGGFEASVSHWLKHIEGLSAHPNLPFTGAAPPRSTASYCRLILKPELEEALHRYRRCRGVPLSAVVLTSYSGALAALAGEHEFLLGIVTANRSEDTANTIGFFANTVAVPTPTALGLSFGATVDRSLEILADVQAYGRAPFDEVVARGGLANGAVGGAPLSAVLVVQNAPEPKFAVPDIEIEVSRIRVGPAKFPMTLFVTETSGRLTFELEYAPDRLSANDAEALLGVMQDILACGLDDIEPPVFSANANWGNKSVVWGETRPDWLDHSVIELIIERAAISPDAIAIVDEHSAHTYGGLVRYMDAYASQLSAAGVVPGDVVVVSLPRGAELLISILAIMRAECVWCPVDPDLPPAYKGTLIAAARPALAIAADTLGRLPRQPPPDLVALPTAPVVALPLPQLDRACYIIHTSGTTGVPKGVIVSHRALANVTAWIADTLVLRPVDRTLWKTPIGFDAVCRELFPILTAGGTLRIAPANFEMDMSALGRLLQETQVTTFHCVPSQLSQLVELAAIPSSLRAIMCGGEALRTELGRRVRAAGPRLINVYGPTEATVDCAFYDARGDEWEQVLPIGRPIANTKLSVVREGHVVMGPAIGELRVSGPNVAIGYTDPGVGDNSFGTDAGDRSYETGDRVHLRQDGIFVFHGRVDRQCKLRGVRIELSAVENELRAEPGVGSAHVECMEGIGLVAFVTPDWHARAPFALPPRGDAGDNWRSVFEAMYENIDQSADPALNIHGWIDSAARLPMPRAEVLFAVDSAARRILAWRPRRILEIGSGAWTLGARLAVSCERYHGIDFSNAAVAYAQRHAEAKALRHVTFEVASALDFDVRGRTFDAIVLNSVIQYLPNREILDTVLSRLAAALGEGGFLFVGDVRNAALDELVSLWRVRMRRRGDELCSNVALAVETDQLNDAELRLHPGFFASFANRNGFAPPLIETKTEAGTSEMARFRFDVTLTRERCTGASSVRRSPIATQANPAIADEVRLLQALRAAPPTTRFDALTEGIFDNLQGKAKLADVGVSGRLVLRLSANPFEIDLIVVPRDTDLVTVCHEAGYLVPEPLREARLIDWSRFINYTATIRQALTARLPSQVIPSLVVPLPRLPMSPNGKRAWGTFQQLAREHLKVAGLAPAVGSLEEAVSEAFEAVLGRRFSLDDDFFALGGHSLLATQVRARLEQRLARAIPLRLLFDAPTPKALGDALRAEASSHDEVRRRVVPRADAATAEVGFAQRRLWFIERLGTAEGVYAVVHAVRLRGSLNLGALTGAVADLFTRHAPLRTAFHDRDGEPIAIVHPPGEASLDDLGLFPSLEAAVEALISIRGHAYDLARAPLARVLLCTLGEEDYLLGLAAHHIVCDGWSMLVATRDLAAFYAARCNPGSPGPPPLQIDYYDLVASERSLERSGAYEPGLKFWTEALKDAPPILALPYDKLPPARRTWRGDKIAFRLSPRQTASLNVHTSETGTTLFMALFTAYAAFLHRLSERDDLVVGTVIANRARVETEPLVGFLVNALAIRSQLSEGATFTSHALAMREILIAASEHQDVPFELLVERLAVDRRADYQAVFQVLFAMQTTPTEELCLGNVVAERVRLPPTGAMFDLSLEMWDGPEGIRGELEYTTDLFLPSTATRFVDRFCAFVEEILLRPNAPLSAAPLLPRPEREMLTSFARGPAVEVHEVDTPLQQVMMQAKHHPNVVAMEGIGTPLTYAALAKRIELLATVMFQAGVRVGDRVGLLLARGPVVAIGYFAAHWLGAVPIYLDSTYPPARLEFLVRTTRLVWLCCTSEVRPSPLPNIKMIWVEREPREEGRSAPMRIDPRDPAYATFTSGSTGVPKVVLVAQAALAGRLAANDRLFGPFTPGTRFAHCYTFNYDGGLSSLFWPITRGATIVFLPLAALGDGSALARHLAATTIAVLDAIPAILAPLYEHWPIGGLPELALVVTGGDVCPPSLVARHFRCSSARFANQYGPCESVINATTAVYHRTPERVTIGRPITGAEVLVLDRSGRPVPIGGHGEIFIGGSDLADGYLDDPKETARRFPLLDPDGTRPRRFYKSGDLGRWLETGELDFLGRSDRQVQINGMRVELLEIETELSRFPGVASCHAFVNKSRVLHACVIPGSQLTVSASAHGEAWGALFDGLYRNAPPAHRNYAGWTETATGEDIPRPQMDAWLDAILALLRRRPIGRVLEIGSGLGLIALELAQDASCYVALDRSAVAVGLLEEESRRRGLANLHVHRLDIINAGDVDLGGPFDLIVVNSVLQYFPNTVTVEALLRRLFALLSDHGRLFVGDVRDYRLRDRFWEAVVCRRTSGHLCERDERRQIIEARSNEEELHLVPEFFMEIGEAAALGLPSILLKQAILDNELSNYRFDVLYDRLATGSAVSEEAISFEESDGLALLAWRVRDVRGPLRIAGIPNKRFAEGGIDPSDVLALADRLELQLFLFVSTDPTRFDAVLIPGQKNCFAALPPARFPRILAPILSANDPLLGMRARAYRETLLLHATAFLPAHMVPARLLFLDRLPIRPGGKIDEEALSELDPAAGVSSRLRAQSDLAFAVMCDIWENLLGPGPFERVSDFFERGGHSLMAARVAAAIRRDFGVALPVVRVFELRQLGALVDEVIRLAEGDSRSSAAAVETFNPSVSCATSLPSPTQAAILRAIDRSLGAASHIGLAIEFKVSIPAAALEDAVCRACSRHPLLTRRFDRDGRVVSGPMSFPLNWRSRGMDELLKEASAPLDLSDHGPLALTAFGVRTRATHIVVRAHPFAFDSDSLLILLRDVAEALRGNELLAAPDYAAWAERERTVAGDYLTEGVNKAFVRPSTSVRSFERRWDKAQARGLSALAADLGVTPAAMLLGRLVAAAAGEMRADRVVVGCAASLRPFLPEAWRDDMIGPLTADVPLAFDAPTTNLPECAFAAASKMTELFRTPGADALGQDLPAITFSYREAALPLTRLWPTASVVRHAIAPLLSPIKLSVSLGAIGVLARLSYRAGALEPDASRRLVEALIPSVDQPNS